MDRTGKSRIASLLRGAGSILDIAPNGVTMTLPDFEWEFDADDNDAIRRDWQAVLGPIETWQSCDDLTEEAVQSEPKPSRE